MALHGRLRQRSVESVRFMRPLSVYRTYGRVVCPRGCRRKGAPDLWRASNWQPWFLRDKPTVAQLAE